MNIDWGKTPLTAGAARGIAMAILLGLAAFLDAYFRQGVLLKTAVGEGLIPAVAAFISLIAYGTIDQMRANRGVVNAADVPVAIEATFTHSDPKAVARTMQRQTSGR